MGAGHFALMTPHMDQQLAFSLADARRAGPAPRETSEVDAVGAGVPDWVRGELGTLPVLSVRQPWATSIVFFGKPVENRKWWGVYLKAQLGKIRVGERFLIHAAKGMDEDDIDGWKSHTDERPSCRPTKEQAAAASVHTFADLPRGGVIGHARYVGWVTQHPSPWFTGPGALVMEDVQPLPFYPCRGMLGFFRLPQREAAPSSAAT